MCSTSGVRAALAGCGIITHTPAGARDPGLAGELQALRDTRGSARLSDLTEFSWDTVHVFREYTSSERVEEVVGRPVLDGDVVTSAWLMAFEHHGEVVEKVRLRADNLRSDQTSWGTDVMVSPWGAGGIMLTLSGAR